ncbi:hypothetical protein AAF712_015662 [Marasmius tenuissimus]|uniref:Uncharacterized protein n=1 Tax=Marasmius tenuissimus TaxID=585030 RepID=A0ABR2Z9M0_9AGAR
MSNDRVPCFQHTEMFVSPRRFPCPNRTPRRSRRSSPYPNPSSNTRISDQARHRATPTPQSPSVPGDPVSTSHVESEDEGEVPQDRNVEAATDDESEPDIDMGPTRNTRVRLTEQLSDDSADEKSGVQVPGSRSFADTNEFDEGPGIVIEKPRGEAGRPNSGGYNLETELKWPPKFLEDVKTFVRQEVKSTLDCDKPITEQDEGALDVIRSKASGSFAWHLSLFIHPKQCVDKWHRLHDYEKAWPIDDLIRGNLKYFKQARKIRRAEAQLERYERAGDPEQVDELEEQRAGPSSANRVNKRSTARRGGN